MPGESGKGAKRGFGMTGPVKGREPQQTGAAAGKDVRQPLPLPTSANLTTTKVREAIQNEPDVRTERVAELRDRIKSGSFEVDADKVAGKILNTHLREDLERP